MNFNKKNIDNYLSDLKDIYKLISDDQTKLLYIQYVFTYLTRNATYFVSDSFFESELNVISSKLKHNIKLNFKPNTVLHIITEAHSTGGHTKLLENIMTNTKHIFDEQSVVITNHSSKKPPSLAEIVQKTGNLTVMSKNDLISKALILSELASQYEYIILHIHPDDILANLAFGNEMFKRPVFVVDHADYRFWVGVSICDLLLGLSSEGAEFAKLNRGVENSVVIHIPIKKTHIDLSREEARKYLGIDQNKKIVLSIASEYKYGSTKDVVNDFIAMCKSIVNGVENCEFILIGPSRKNIFWNGAYKESKGKINPIGSKPMEELKYYIKSCDLYIESFPFGSYTAFLDVAAYNVNMMRLKTVSFELDSVKLNNLSQNSIDEIIDQSIKLLNMDLKQQVSYNLEMHYEKLWTENFLNFIQNTKVHKVHEFLSKPIKDSYYDFLQSTLEDNLGLRKIYQKLPYKIKIKLFKAMINNGKVNSWKQFYKLFYKTII